MSIYTDACEEIRWLYRNYPHPWVIGYSGGKDSTATLQLVWQALAGLPSEERTKRVYVISTDTRVETPVIVEYIRSNLRLINERAAEQGMPFEAHQLEPVLNDTFWVNLIGRGYPAPNAIFRWCTDRLKINPSNRFILNQVQEHGEVILALGMRGGESDRRDRTLDRYRLTGHKLSRHSRLAGAWVYMPIESFTVQDVWIYLLQVPSPWGGDDHRLRALYRSANDDECPLVVDDSTPPCGNSRFGCWVCTLVDKDQSMESMIDSGYEWLEPLLEYRDWLASTQDPSVKPRQREYKGRNGRIRITGKGLLWRTFTLEFLQKVLRRLLQTQAQIQQAAPDCVLIGEAELREIRRLWLTERQDWQDALPRIYQEVTGTTLDWERNDVSRPGMLELELLERVADQHDLPTRLAQELLDAEWQYHGMRRRALIHKTIERIMEEDWRSLKEVLADAEQRIQQDESRAAAE